MVEDSVPSASSKDAGVNSCRKRVMRPRNSHKRQNAIDAQTETPDISRKKQPTGEKLMKSELKSRFSYVPKKLNPQTCERVDVKRQKQCSSETDQPCSSYTTTQKYKPGISGVNCSEVSSSLKSQPSFDIEFTRRLSDSLLKIGSGIVKTHQSSLCTSSNILHYVNNVSQGLSYNLKQAKKRLVVSHVAKMDTFTTHSPFDRRVTALTFHPKFPTILAAASKGGEIILWNTEECIHGLSIPGVGPGGSILAMKFHHEKKRIVYTASLTGSVMQQDFLGKDNITFFHTNNCNIWFTSLDTSVPYKLVLAGDTQGYMHLASFDGQKVWNFAKRVYKNKVTHAEFSTRDPYIFVTASLDHTVKIWDLRMFSDRKDPPESICCLDHNKGVNSAYFNPSNGTSLLTTDQHKELRVYTAPLWHLETVIEHPHRQFQHLTPIKAQWHPLEDLIVVGRYPDDNVCKHDMRSIDIYDAHTGKRKHYFSTTSIASLSAFNPTGDILATASGTCIGLWKPKEACKDSVKVSTIAAQKLLSRRSRSKSSNCGRSKLVTSAKEKGNIKQKKKSH